MKHEVRTISIRIPQKKITEPIIELLLKVSHLRNLLIILIKGVYAQNSHLHRLLLTPDILRALLFNRKGGKKAVLVQKAKLLVSNLSIYNLEIFNNAFDAAQYFDAKHAYKLAKSLSGEFKGFVTKIKKGEKAKPPRAKKLREISNAAIALDSERVYIKDQQFHITIGKECKLQIPFNKEELDQLIGLKNILSYRLCFDGRDVTLNISYKKQVKQVTINSHTKSSAIDLGVNNLCSLFILDQTTPSLILSGKFFKHFNHNFNRKKAKLASKKDNIANRLTEIEEEVYEALDDSDGVLDEEICESIAEWQQLKPKFDSYKKQIDKLYSRRKRFFHTNFQKVARSILRHLEKHSVNQLILSRNILRAKQKSKMGKRGNQKFVYIPFAKLLDALKLYGIEHGIEVVDSVDEAYTSKTNCLFGNIAAAQNFKYRDKKDPQVKKDRATAFQGRRHKGSFHCKVTKKVWHSDLNGACNHLSIYLDRIDLGKLRTQTFKLESPKVLRDRELFKWLDAPLVA